MNTADSSGPDVSEGQIREALPHVGLLIATNGQAAPEPPDQWTPNVRPEYLISQARRSLDRRGVAQGAA